MPDWVETVTITFPSGRTADEVCATELATVVWMANLGTLRYHPWPTRRPDTEKVDQLRIDLDPQPGTDFADAVRAAYELRGVLDDAGLVGWPKSSGGRGVHVFVPVEPAYGFIEARHAVIALGRELSRRMPEHVTISWWKEERGKRIFVDFNQMARDRTIASAYSIRPTPTAVVSAPLTWDELGDARAGGPDRPHHADPVRRDRRRLGGRSTRWSRAVWTARWRCTRGTSASWAPASTAVPRCRTRRTTRRCRASRPGSNRAE